MLKDDRQDPCSILTLIHCLTMGMRYCGVMPPMHTFMHILTGATALLLNGIVVAAEGDTCNDAIPASIGETTFDSSLNTDSGTPVDGNCGLMGVMSRDIWFTHTPASDGMVTLQESELLRAVTDALGCPLPPLLATVS